MSLEKDISLVLQQYATDTGVYSAQKVERDFIRIAQQISPEDVTSGLLEAIRSEQTPPFEQMVGQSFEQGDGHQRAAMLNRLLDGAGPAAVRPLAENRLLKEAWRNVAYEEPAITPELAEKLEPELVQQIAYEAQQENPGIVEKLGNFYAEDPELAIKLGGGTLSVALIKIAESR